MMASTKILKATKALAVSSNLPHAVIGRVVDKSDVIQAVKVKVEDLKFDDFLNMYFAEHTKHWASDPGGTCNVGDIVFMKKLPKPQSDTVYHYIKEIVFKVGEVVDPVTGRRCRGTEFIKEDQRKFEPLLQEFKPKPSS